MVIRFCPFPPCAAALHMVAERAAPGPDPDVVVRYPEHPVAGVAVDLQLCPATLMAFPLGPVEVAHLATAAGEMERQLNERAARIADETPRKPVRPRVGESDWFRWNGGGGGAHTGRYDGYVAPPVMPQVLMPHNDQEGQS